MGNFFLFIDHIKSQMRAQSGSGGWEAECGHARRFHLCCHTETRQQLFLQACEGRQYKSSFQVGGRFNQCESDLPKVIEKAEAGVRELSHSHPVCLKCLQSWPFLSLLSSQVGITSSEKPSMAVLADQSNFSLHQIGQLWKWMCLYPIILLLGECILNSSKLKQISLLQKIRGTSHKTLEGCFVVLWIMTCRFDLRPH